MTILALLTQTMSLLRNLRRGLLNYLGIWSRILTKGSWIEIINHQETKAWKTRSTTLFLMLLMIILKCSPSIKILILSPLLLVQTRRQRLKKYTTRLWRCQRRQNLYFKKYWWLMLLKVKIMRRKPGWSRSKQRCKLWKIRMAGRYKWDHLWRMILTKKFIKR